MQLSPNSTVRMFLDLVGTNPDSLKMTSESLLAVSNQILISIHMRKKVQTEFDRFNSDWNGTSKSPIDIPTIDLYLNLEVEINAEPRPGSLNARRTTALWHQLLNPKQTGQIQDRVHQDISLYYKNQPLFPGNNIERKFGVCPSFYFPNGLSKFPTKRAETQFWRHDRAPY